MSLSREDICEFYINKTLEIEISKSEESTKWKSRKENEFLIHSYCGNDKKMKNWTRRYDLINQVVSYVYECPNELKKQCIKEGLVGTDGTVVIKNLNKKSYRPISTDENYNIHGIHEDKFIKCGFLFCDAVLNKNIINHFIKNSKIKNNLNDWVENLKKEFEKKILRECKIDLIKINNEEKINANRYIKNISKKANNIIQELVIYIAQELQRACNYTLSLEKIIEKIEEAKRNNDLLLKIKQGLPLTIKFKEINSHIPRDESDDYDNKEENNKSKLVNAEFPLGWQTIPSEYQYRYLHSSMSNKSISMVNNNVSYFSGIISPKSKITPFAFLNTHDTYSFVDVEDDLERRYYAYLGFKEIIIQHMEDKLKKEAFYKRNMMPSIKVGIDGEETDNSDQNQSIEKYNENSKHNISAYTSFSTSSSENSDDPDFNYKKTANKILSLSSSNNQSNIFSYNPNTRIGSLNNPIKISLTSLMLINPGKHFYEQFKNKRPIDLFLENAMILDHYNYTNLNSILVDKKSYFVAFHISSMNCPKYFSPSSSSYFSGDPLQFQKIINDRGFCDYYDKIREKLRNLLEELPNYIDLKIEDATYTEVNEVLDLIDGADTPTDKNEVNSYEEWKNKLLEIKNDINVQHQQCVDYLCSYGESLIESRSHVKLSEYKKGYYDAEKKIISLEKKLHDYYAYIVQSRKRKFNEITSKIDNLIVKLNQELSTNNELNEIERNFYLLILRFLRTQDAYYNEIYNDSLYYFHLNYLLSLYQADELIEAFEFHSKEQTSNLKIMLLAYQEFNKKYHTDPNIKNNIDIQNFDASLPEIKKLSVNFEYQAAPQIRPKYLKKNVILFNPDKMNKSVIDNAKKKAAWKDISFTRSYSMGFSIGLIVAIPASVLLMLFTGGLGFLLLILAIPLVYAMAISATVELCQWLKQKPSYLDNIDTSPIQNDDANTTNLKKSSSTGKLYKGFQSHSQKELPTSTSAQDNPYLDDSSELTPDTTPVTSPELIRAAMIKSVQPKNLSDSGIKNLVEWSKEWERVSQSEIERSQREALARQQAKKKKRQNYLRKKQEQQEQQAQTQEKSTASMKH